MKKILIILLVFLSVLPLYAQNQYVIHVSAIWMANFATEISYSGDYNGTGTTSFDIGPYNEPFTVTLTILHEYENALAANLKFGMWNISDTYGELSVTVTVDNTQPEVNAVAQYANIEPTPPPSVTPSGETPPPDSTPAPVYGLMWLDPSDLTVNRSEAFTWDVFADTGPQKLAAYGIDVSWPVPAGGIIMRVDTSIGNNGVEAGVDGFIAAVNPNNAMGTIRISGFDTEGTGPSYNLHLCVIHFIAGSRALSGAAVSVAVDTMVDVESQDIGMHRGMDAVIRIRDMILGDVNEDGAIDIIDALVVAQYYVDLNPPAYTAPLEAGDSNQDGNVDIVDALMIAQYYVGICGCPYFPPK